MFQYPNQNTISPKPPDINSQQALMEAETSSFKDKLMAYEHKDNKSILFPLPHQIPVEINITTDNNEIQSEIPHSNTYTVPVTTEDKQKIYYPWRFSLIIKVQGKRILHKVLKRKLIELWKPSQSFPLIDLGEDYYIVRFNKEENMVNSL